MFEIRDLSAINADAITLKERISNTNRWVSKHPDTDPNYYEFIDFLVSFGELAFYATKYFDQNGWPKLPDGKKEMTHYDVWRATPELESCDQELTKLTNSRGIGKIGFTNYVINEEANTFYSYLFKDCVTGDYIVDHDPIMRRIKKELICKSFSVPFYIWQEKRENPNYQYDNEEEYETLQAMKACYEASESLYPQYQTHITAMFDQIQKNSKFAKPVDAQQDNISFGTK